MVLLMGLNEDVTARALLQEVLRATLLQGKTIASLSTDLIHVLDRIDVLVDPVRVHVSDKVMITHPVDRLRPPSKGIEDVLITELLRVECHFPRRSRKLAAALLAAASEP